MENNITLKTKNNEFRVEKLRAFITLDGHLGVDLLIRNISTGLTHGVYKHAPECLSKYPPTTMYMQEVFIEAVRQSLKE